MVVVQKKQYNVLLLGQTGVGKSTFINGFCNYLSFKDLNEALETSQGEYVVPTMFEWYNDQDGQLSTINIGLHEDENERQEVGKSTTQYVRSYLFEFGNVAIRIIDTPGFGDTEGGDIDERICENLFRFLSNRREVQELHGIVFLFKPNENRMTVFFKYCLDQIFSKLHRNACENIAFVFTHAKGTNYRPASTLGLLKGVISKMQNVNVQCSKQNIFCIENDCIKFLFAFCHATNITFDDNTKEDYELPWKRSYQEYMRLFKYLTSLKPHSVEDTIRVNSMRHDCIKLKTLLPKIINEIDENIQRCTKLEKEIVECERDVASLNNVLYKFSNVDRGKNRLLVCHNKKCRSRSGSDKVICCSGCTAWTISLCKQINLWKSSCRACGCNELEHTLEKGGVEIKKEKDERIEGDMVNKEKIINRSLLNLYEQKIKRKKYEAEKAFIENYLIKLARYLEKITISSDQQMHRNAPSAPDNSDAEMGENEDVYLPFVECLSPSNFEMIGEYIKEMFKEEDVHIPLDKVKYTKTTQDWQEIINLLKHQSSASVQSKY